MSGLLLPSATARELLAERERREAEATQALREEEQWGWVQEFNRHLKSIEPYLKLVFCPDPAPLDAAAAGAQPGRWHVVRFNPGAPISFIVLQNPDGSYREPGSWVFDRIRQSDLWNDQVNRERDALIRRAEEAKERQIQADRAARDEDMVERVRAVTRTQVSMNRDTPWAQNAAGRRRRDPRRSEE